MRGGLRLEAEVLTISVSKLASIAGAVHAPPAPIPGGASSSRLLTQLSKCTSWLQDAAPERRLLLRQLVFQLGGPQHRALLLRPLLALRRTGEGL